MPLFLNNNEQLTEVSEIPFKLEKEIQQITEKNLHSVFKLDMVRTELEINGLRIDTLAFDNETSSFVIIEYKKDRNFSVVDQGMAYLALLLNNKAEFVLEYNENKNKSLKKDDVDWSQSRVMFVAPTFTKYQQQALGFKDLPIELWEVKRYTNKIILYTQVKAPESRESIEKLSGKSQIVRQIAKEVRIYNEEERINLGSDKTKELYCALKSAILNLGDDITIKPVKHYIGFKRKTNFTDITIQRSKLIVYINLPKGKLNDPQRLARDISSIGHWGNGDYEIRLVDHNLIPYVITLIKQSYDNNLLIRGQFSSGKHR